MSAMDADAGDFSGDLPLGDPVSVSDATTSSITTATASSKRITPQTQTLLQNTNQNSGEEEEEKEKEKEKEDAGRSQDYCDWRDQMDTCEYMYELKAIGALIANAASLLPETELASLRSIYEARSVVLKAREREAATAHRAKMEQGTIGNMAMAVTTATVTAASSALVVQQTQTSPGASNAAALAASQEPHVASPGRSSSFSSDFVMVSPEQQMERQQSLPQAAQRSHVLSEDVTKAAVGAAGDSSASAAVAAAATAGVPDGTSAATMDNVPAPSSILVDPAPPPPPPKTPGTEWKRLFDRADYYETLRSEALTGGLNRTPFPGLLWSIFLGVLPTAREDWEKELQRGRKTFQRELDSIVRDPRSSTGGDLSLNNPLSLAEDSPWQRHFEDTRLRDEIRRDVNRTFPEVPFFQSEDVREDMVTLLFCYARKNPHVAYRQGMHELLAPILLVVDRERFRESRPHADEYTEEMKNILDADYTLHDAYAIFSAVMRVTSDWFVSQDEATAAARKAATEAANARKASAAAATAASAMPFAEPRMAEPSSAIQHKLAHIHTVMLQDFDAELHARLHVLDIPPQIYGLRWVRLLLSREFDLDDTLVIWTAIFADSRQLDLIDALCVALLTYIREFVLSFPYTDCLRILMKYPPIDDVRNLVQKALHIRNPSAFPDLFWSAAPPRAAEVTTGGGSGEKPQVRQQAAPANKTARTARSRRQVQASSTNIFAEESVTKHKRRPRGGKGGHTSEEDEGRPLESVQDLKDQIKRLEGELGEMRAWTKHYGTKLDASIGRLQGEVMAADRLPDEEALYMTLAEMKEVKDVLLGRIRPDLSVLSSSASGSGSSPAAATAGTGAPSASRDAADGAPSASDTVDLSYANLGVIKVVLGTDREAEEAEDNQREGGEGVARDDGRGPVEVETLTAAVPTSKEMKEDKVVEEGTVA